MQSVTLWSNTDFYENCIYCTCTSETRFGDNIPHAPFRTAHYVFSAGLKHFTKYTERVQTDPWENSAMLKKDRLWNSFGESNWDLRRYRIICILINYWIFTGEKEDRNSAELLFQEQGDLGDLFSKTLQYEQEEKVLMSFPALEASMFSLQNHWLPKSLNWGSMPNFGWKGKLKRLKGKLIGFVVILVKKKKKTQLVATALWKSVLQEIFEGKN